MMSYNSISIIIPAFNEEQAIGGVVDGLRKELGECEILVIDDGSSDKTAEVAGQHACTIIKHDVNRGYGASWKTGLLKAKGDIVVFCDGDGQFQPGDVHAAVDHFIENDADMTSGFRGQDSHRPWLRRPGKRLLLWVAELLQGRSIPDLNCGLRVVRRRILRRYMHILPNGFSASSTSLMIFFHRGYKVNFHPVSVKKRLGKSSVSIFSDGFGTLLLLVRLIALFNPLRVFLPISGIFVLFAILYSIYEIVVRGLGVPVLGATLFSGGLLIFLVGIVCDQISSMRLEQFELARLGDRS